MNDKQVKTDKEIYALAKYYVPLIMWTLTNDIIPYFHDILFVKT